MSRWLSSVLAVAVLPGVGAASDGGRCDALMARFASVLAEIECFESTDLTTNGANTTPAEQLHRRRFRPLRSRPVTDRGVIAPAAPDQTPLTKAVPGIQLEARIADDPTRRGALPAAPAGRLERQPRGRRRLRHAQRVQRRLRLERLRRPEGLRLRLAEQGHPEPPSLADRAADPLGCRLNPAVAVCACTSTTTTPDSPSRVARYMVEAARARARRREGALRPAARATPTRSARRTAATRCAAPIETAPRALRRRRRLGRHLRRSRTRRTSSTDLPPGDPELPGLRRVRLRPGQHGGEEHPWPPVIRRTSSSRRRHGTDRSGSTTGTFWEVTQCQWQKRLDPDLRHLRHAAPAPTTTSRGPRLGRRREDRRVRDHRARSSGRSSPWPGRWTRCCRSITTPAPTRARWTRRATRRDDDSTRHGAVPPLRGAERQPHRDLPGRPSRSSSSSSRTRSGRSTCSCSTWSGRAAAARPVHPAGRLNRRGIRRSPGPARSCSCPSSPAASARLVGLAVEASPPRPRRASRLRVARRLLAAPDPIVASVAAHAARLEVVGEVDRRGPRPGWPPPGAGSSPGRAPPRGGRCSAA